MTPLPPEMGATPQRAPIAWAGIGVVVAAAAVNVYLVLRLVLQAGVPASEVMATIPFPLVLSLAPVAVMMYVATRPTPSRVGQWSVLIGSLVFLSLDVVLMVSTISYETSTALLGFVFSIPVLLAVAGLTVIPVTFSNDRASARRDVLEAPDRPLTPRT